ncbi:MAG: hypothetical protein GWM98_27995, partial [Nitrospinaceae bacterium]|nr:aminotransferase class IV [Nitrospinaceae bacterium]NIR57597.1 aminotransferase class IV [Nitrospinaceae bacterium]NIS88067.1 aminotransferase class IV [Nitrospinaceae bacterium]NIT84931.1 aminotransferase class IV [Nitrospinaceae bacterium]NIU47107.1 aminotransferase class IV [Nitrospinaceae bacterium]
TARELKSAIEETLSRNRYSDAVIRVNVSRGEQPPGLRLDSAAPPTVAITVRPLEPVSQQLYQTGASVALFPRSAVTTSGLGSQIKSCNFLSNIIIRELAVRKKVFEGILMDPQGRLAEGTTSNIFL